MNEMSDEAKYIGYDDEENSLIHRLLKKDNLNECYQRLFQMTRHKKEECVWAFIIRVFLDFYAELNPKLEHFIFKLKNESRTAGACAAGACACAAGACCAATACCAAGACETTLTFAYIIKNMFIRKSISYNVYNARIGVSTYKYTVPNFKNKKYIIEETSFELVLLISEPGNKKYSILLNALHSKNIDKIAFKLFAHLRDGDDVDIIHRTIIKYFSRVYFTQAQAEQAQAEQAQQQEAEHTQAAEQAQAEQIEKRICDKWLQIKKNITQTPENYFHYLITIVIHLFAQQKDINESILFVRPNPDILLLVD